MTSVSFSPEQLVLLGGILVWIGAKIYTPTKHRRKALAFGSAEIVFIFIGLVLLLFGAAVILKQNPTF